MLKLLKMKLSAPDVENLWAVWFPCAISAYRFREQRPYQLNFFLCWVAISSLSLGKKKKDCEGHEWSCPCLVAAVIWNLLWFALVAD